MQLFQLVLDINFSGKEVFRLEVSLHDIMQEPSKRENCGDAEDYPNRCRPQSANVMSKHVLERI